VASAPETKPYLSIILPVYNEMNSLKIMVQILEATIEVPHEVIVVYDSPDDNSIEAVTWLRQRYSNVHGHLNESGRGVARAIQKGMDVSRGEVLLITVVDEIFPIASIHRMLDLIDRGCDMVSCTRYALGGKRLGGSWIGGILSRVANRTFRILAGSILTDATTGIKMARRHVFETIRFDACMGWAFAFELSIKAQLMGLRLGEVPIVSIDRLFGGDSTFKLRAWVVEYLRWFFWGIRELRTSRRTQARPDTWEDTFSVEGR
jgi:dolichol-phosphate mannosyltransferase